MRWSTRAAFRSTAAWPAPPRSTTPGTLKSFGPANVVTGIAKLDGRPIVVCGDDFTVGGAAYSAVGIRKGIYGDELAAKRRIPMVRLLEGGGARISGALGAKPGARATT